MTDKKRGAPKGNRNAAKTTRRQMLSIRLPQDLMDRLRREPDKTKLIETLLRQHFAPE